MWCPPARSCATTFSNSPRSELWLSFRKTARGRHPPQLKGDSRGLHSVFFPLPCCFCSCVFFAPQRWTEEREKGVALHPFPISFCEGENKRMGWTNLPHPSLSDSCPLSSVVPTSVGGDVYFSPVRPTLRQQHEQQESSVSSPGHALAGLKFSLSLSLYVFLSLVTMHPPLFVPSVLLFPLSSERVQVTLAISLRRCHRLRATRC